MSQEQLAVREATSEDIPAIVGYWVNSEDEYLRSLGVDLNKRPNAQSLTDILRTDFAKSIKERNAFCLIWLMDGRAIGHCNTNPTTFGRSAHMHLHIWKASDRRKGFGEPLLRMSIPLFFEKL